MKDLYDSDDMKLMQISCVSLNKSRLQELIDFAKNAGFKRIGIANCISMQKYAEHLAALLKAAGFEVFGVNCREGGLDFADYMADRKGSSCDPAFQADYLNSMNTDLNINVGLCLGHGLIFNKKSKAMATTLIVKDFATKHHTVCQLED